MATRARILADYVSSGDELALKAPLASPAFTGSPSITLGSDATGDVYYRAAGGALTRLATGADGTVLTSTGAAAVPAFEAVPAGGSTMLDSWRLTTDTSGDIDPFSANLERNDSAGFSHLVGMSVSSGIWTFPSTGFYLVMMSVAFDEQGGGAQGWCKVRIEVTINNSSYIQHGVGYDSISGTDHQTQVLASSIIDVTDTSNVKVKFSTDGLDASNRVIANSAQDTTSFKFIRLGDT